MAKRLNVGRMGGLGFMMLIFWVCATSAWCVQSDYDGYYAGTYIGVGSDDSGIWVAIADETSGVYGFLSYSTHGNEADGGDLTWQGEASGVGHFSDYTDGAGTFVDIYITLADGGVEGTWDNAYSEESGDITGDLVTSCSDAGRYTGTYTGDDSGTWSMVIGEDCLITGTITSDDETFAFTGGAHPSHYVVFAGDDTSGGAFIGGGRLENGGISGTWESESYGEGTFGSGDDDDSTCFIGSLLIH